MQHQLFTLLLCRDFWFRFEISGLDGIDSWGPMPELSQQVTGTWKHFCSRRQVVRIFWKFTNWAESNIGYEETSAKRSAGFEERRNKQLILTLILLMWRTEWTPNSIPKYVYIQQDATLHSLFISGNFSTCFGWYFHPSSETHTTVSTASGICHTVTAICRYRGRVGTSLSVLWMAYATHSTQLCTNDTVCNAASSVHTVSFVHSCFAGKCILTGSKE
jgi:hypothetical protein